jgi:hypothetical protein
MKKDEYEIIKLERVLNNVLIDLYFQKKAIKYLKEHYDKKRVNTHD